MYLHLGNNVLVNTANILGIFDMDTATMKKSTQKYLEKLQEKKKLIDVTENLLPKSVVIVKTKKEEIAYLSSLSTATLQKRIKGNDNLKKTFV